MKRQPLTTHKTKKQEAESLTLAGKTVRKKLPRVDKIRKEELPTSMPIVPFSKPSPTKVLIRSAVEGMDAGEFFIGLGKLGFTIPEIARCFGMDEQKLYDALRSEPALKAAYVEALEEPNRSVEAALFKKAMGFTTVEKEFDGGGNLKKVKSKHVAPDITAIIFWLKNRSLGKWQDVNKVQVELPLADRLTAGHERIREKRGELQLLEQSGGVYSVPPKGEK